MRIAFLTSEYVTEKNFDGGLSNYLHRVAKGLVSRGHEVEVFVISNKDETIINENIITHRVIPQAKWFKYSCRIFGNYLSGFRWLLLESYSLNRRFMERHKEKRFDIAQIPNYRASGLFLTFGSKCPVITRISSYARLLNEAYGKKRNIDVHLQEWLEKVEIRRSFKAYAPSRYLADIISKELKRKIDVIKPPFINEAVMYKNDIYLRELKDKQYILFFGTIGRLKGVLVLLEALKKTVIEDLNIVFIGKDTLYEKNKTCMEKVTEELIGYKNRIYHFNSLQHSELYPILMNSKVVVLPSLVDNIPNTCIEAMAHGCIVVASDGASMDELIENGISGILFKLGDPSSLADKILYAWNLPDPERKKISDNAKKAIEKLAPETALKELEDYYIKAVKEWET